MRASLLTLMVAAMACGENEAKVATLDEGATANVRHLATPTLVVEYEYDAEGRPTSVTRSGAKTSFAYDAETRTLTNPLGGTSTATLNARDELTRLVDPRGLVTELERDGFSDVTTVRSGDTGTATKVYDEAGNLSSFTDARGVTSTLSHDALGRLTRVVHERAGEEALFTYSYDDDGGLGQLSATTFPGGSTERDVDETGAVTRLAQHVGGVSTVVSYERDALGRVIGLRYPSGRRLGIEWSNGAPVALSLGEADAGAVLVDGIVLRGGELETMRWRLATGDRVQERTYDTTGRLARYPLGEGTRTLEFDAAGRVVGYLHFGANGLPAAGTKAVANASDETFVFDALGRLIGFGRAGASHEVTLDAVGNRTSLDAGTVTTRWNIAADSNRLATDGHEYDESGSLLGDGTFTATYDLAGRMDSFTRAGATMTTLADAWGHRVLKEAFGHQLVFVRDDEGRLLGEYDEAGGVVREYLWLGGTLVGFFFANEFFFVQVDHLGAPRVAIDLQGRIRWNWLVNPFGDGVPPAVEVEGVTALGLFDLPLRFPGQYADVETGLFHNHFREYDPSTGRYLQADPIGLAGGTNGYVYVEGDPVNAFDPDGLEKLNFFDPVKDNESFRNAENAPDSPGALIIHAHGNDEALKGPEGQTLEAPALAKYIRDSGKWRPGMVVVLLACRVGETREKSLVSKLARELGARVVGPETDIIDLPDGTWMATNDRRTRVSNGRFYSAGPRKK